MDWIGRLHMRLVDDRLPHPTAKEHAQLCAFFIWKQKDAPDWRPPGPLSERVTMHACTEDTQLHVPAAAGFLMSQTTTELVKPITQLKHKVGAVGTS